MVYMIGWRKGTTGAAADEAHLANEDFRAGYVAGRAAKKVAYGAACLTYGAILNPLREGQGDDDS